jgi:two-component system LytT family response regulator
LSRLTERLDPRTFVRVHRSTVVNVDRVREVQPWFRSELVVILKDDTRLTIGRRYRDEFLRALEG